MITRTLEPAETEILLADGTYFDLSSAKEVVVAEPWIEIRYWEQVDPIRRQLRQTTYLSPTEWSGGGSVTPLASESAPRAS